MFITDWGREEGDKSTYVKYTIIFQNGKPRGITPNSLKGGQRYNEKLFFMY